MFIYNSAAINISQRNNKKTNSIVKKKKKSSKSKKRKSGGRIKSLCKKNVKFLKSIGFKVKKSRKTY